MSPTRARELLHLAQTAIKDAQVKEISAWTRLMATYDAAVCVVAVIAEIEIPPWIERDDVLEKLLRQAKLDGNTMDELQTICRRYRLDSRGCVVVTHADVDRALRCVERLWNEAESQVARAANE